RGRGGAGGGGRRHADGHRRVGGDGRQGGAAGGDARGPDAGRGRDPGRGDRRRGGGGRRAGDAPARGAGDGPAQGCAGAAAGRRGRHRRAGRLRGLRFSPRRTRRATVSRPRRAVAFCAPRGERRAGVMFPRMIARATPVLLALALAAAPASAQVIPVEGRWRVLVRAQDPGREALRGELRLVDAGDGLRGTLRLESDSGPPLALSRPRRPAPDSLELERPDQGPLTLAGRWNGIAWRGEVARAGQLLGHWEAVALGETEEYYPAPPTFLLRQLILGSPAHGIEAPGPWHGAALARLGAEPAAALAARHAEAAGRAGAPAVPRERLAADGDRWLRGLVDRDRWRGALARDLARLRAGLDGPARERFDVLFEPGAGWITDLHDAAIRAARRRQPDAGWSDWAP